MEAANILTQAMKLEKNGREAYLQAASVISDPETANTFRLLAEDEVHHYEYLERQLASIQAGKSWVDIPELDSVKAIDAKAPIFPSGKKIIEKLPTNPSEEDALLFGLNAEVKSFDLYHQSAKELEDLEARKMFEALAKAEQHHFDLLMMRYESIFTYPR